MTAARKNPAARIWLREIHAGARRMVGMTTPAFPSFLRRVQLSLLGFLCLAVLRLPAAEPAAATKTFDIPAGNAAETLKQFSAQTGADDRLLYSTEAVAGVKTNAVQGEMTARAALDQMVAGTELSVVEDRKAGGLMLVRSSDPNAQRVAPLAATSDRPAGSTEAARGAPAAADVVVKLDPFNVKETAAGVYGATDSVTGSRIALPLVDLPTSLVVVTRAFMDDMGATSYLGALSYVSGMSAASDVKNGAMTLRGLEVRGDSFSVIDGLPFGLGDAQHETEFVERYEVVKGAAGTLYGNYSLGGLVNRVYKQPLDKRKTTIGTSYSSIGNTLHGVVDDTGPIGRKGEVTYRLVGVLQEGKEITGGADNKHGLYGMVQYRPNLGDTKFWLRLSQEYLEFNNDEPNAIIDVTGQSSTDYFSAKQPFAPTYNDNDVTYNYDEIGCTTSTSGALGDWTARVVVRYTQALSNQAARPEIIPLEYTFLDAAGQSLGVLGVTPNASGPNPTFRGSPWKDIRLTDALNYWSGPNQSEQRGAFFDLTGAFQTGPAEHRALFYVQTIEHSSRSRFLVLTLKPEYGGARSTNNLNLAKAYSLVNPVVLPTSLNLFEPYTLGALYSQGNYSDQSVNGNNFNAGLQDNIYLWNKRVLLVGGARYDVIHNDGVYDNVGKTNGTPQDTTNWVYKASGVVKPFADPGMAIFANYSQTFVPQFGPIAAGVATNLKNQTGTSREIGFKMELLNSQLNGTISYFENELTNNLTFVFDPTLNRNVYAQNGVSTAKGWEADVTWNINSNWTTLVALSDVDSHQPNGLGNRNVPLELNYKALVRYSAHTGPLDGFSFGLGVIHMSRRNGSYGGYYFIPGYTTWDGFVTYKLDHHWKLQLNGYNLTNTKGIMDGLGQLSYNHAIAPVNGSVSVTYGF